MAHQTIIDCDRCGEVLTDSGVQNSVQVLMFHRVGAADVTTAYFCYTARADGARTCGDQFLDLVREFATAEDIVPAEFVPAPLVQDVEPYPAPDPTPAP